MPIFGEAPSVERALDLYAQAGARGSADALYALGVLRYVGHGPDCPRPRGNQIFNPTSIEWFGPASSAVLRALNESIRPKVSRIDFDVTELESSKVWENPAR